MSYHWRAFIMFQGINLSRDVAENAKARKLYEQVIKVASDHGWGIYRAHAAFMDAVMDRYSFNNHALMRMNETLKDALDPNGILSAGRYGIWPKQLRKGRV
jgi:4-cresol dehydrogenase (hydroxylating)